MIQNMKQNDETDINSMVTIWQKLKFSKVHIIFMIGFLFFNIDIILTVFNVEYLYKLGHLVLCHELFE